MPLTILAQIAADPGVHPDLQRAFELAQPRRFGAESQLGAARAPVEVSFQQATLDRMSQRELDESARISFRGSDRWNEVRDDEHADALSDEQMDRSEE